MILINLKTFIMLINVQKIVYKISNIDPPLKPPLPPLCPPPHALAQQHLLVNVRYLKIKFKSLQ